MNNSRGKVTLSCRILPLEKLVLAKEAEKLNLTLSEYVEALVLKEHNHFQTKKKEKVPKSGNVELEIGKGSTEFKTFEFFMDYLQSLFPEEEKEVLLIAALATAHSSSEELLSRNFTTCLRRIKNGHYYNTSKNNDEDDE